MTEPIIKYYQTGEISSEYWYVNGVPHRTDGPAMIVYYPSGKIKFTEWLVNGKYHRIDGPAQIFYQETGEIKSEYWHLNDKDIYPKRWLEENGYKWPLNKQQQIELLLRFA